MAIYAIGDLHFSGLPPTKSMEVFGAYWLNHREKVIKSWQETVQPEDTVVLCGDTSWSMDLPSALKEDLTTIISLPGHKVLLKGNHDYWWTSLTKMTETTENKLHFLHNNAYFTGKIAICGTRGWNLPSLLTFTPHDEAIYTREAMRLETSLQLAKKEGATNIIVALHYPPLYKAEDDSLFTALCEKYGVATCIYGHVHGDAARHLELFQGEKNGTNYQLVAADYLDFKLLKIL